MIHRQTLFQESSVVPHISYDIVSMKIGFGSRILVESEFGNLYR